MEIKEQRVSFVCFFFTWGLMTKSYNCGYGCTTRNSLKAIELCTVKVWGLNLNTTVIPPPPK